MDYTDRKHPKTGQNKTKNNQKSKRQFYESHQFVWQKGNCFKYHCTPEPISWKNVSTPTMRKISCEAGLQSRAAVKKLLLRKQNNVKRLQWAQVHKYWTREQWNKVLWTEKSTFKIFGSNRRVYVRQKVGEKAATPMYYTNYKAQRRLCHGVGVFYQLQNRRFALSERQIK